VSTKIGLRCNTLYYVLLAGLLAAATHFLYDHSELHFILSGALGIRRDHCSYNRIGMF